MTATIPPPYTILLDARRAGATTTHLLDALAYSAAANAAEFRATATWDTLIQEATDRVYRVASYRAAEGAEIHGIDLDTGITYDELPAPVAVNVITSAFVAACNMCDRTDENGTPIAELLSENAADEDHEIGVTPALPDDTERGDLIEFVQKNGKTLLTPPAGSPVFRFIQQVSKLADAHRDHSVTWTITHPATGKVLKTYRVTVQDF